MLKGNMQKVMSMLLALAVLCTIAAVPVMAFEATDDPNVIYQRDYDNDEDSTKYIHSATTPDGSFRETTDGISAVITEADGNRAHRMKGTLYHEFYFTKGVTAADGILHLSFNMKAVQLVTQTWNYSFPVQVNGTDIDVIKVLGDELRPCSSSGWQGYDHDMKLAGYQGEYSETTDETTNETTIEWTNNGPITTGTLTADDYNRVDLYFDLGTERIGYVVNGVSAIHTFAEVTTNTAKLNKDATLEAFGIRASGSTELYFDDIQAKVVDSTLADAMLADGYGASAVTFDEAYTDGKVVVEFDITFTDFTISQTIKMGMVGNDDNDTRYDLACVRLGGDYNTFGLTATSTANWQPSSNHTTIKNTADHTIRFEVDMDAKVFKVFLDGTQIGDDKAMVADENLDDDTTNDVTTDWSGLLTNGIKGFKIDTTNGYTLSRFAYERVLAATADNYEVLGCYFVDKYNQITNQTTLQAGGDFALKVKTSNPNDSLRSCYAIVAVYGTDNQLLSVELQKIDNAANTKGTTRVNFSVPTDDSAAKVKAFVWDSLTGMSPILGVVQ